MKWMILNLIAFIIAASSLQVNFRSEINFSEHDSDNIGSLPSVNLHTLRTPSRKSFGRVEVTFHNDIELFISKVQTNLPTIPFLYYLPIYSLKRVKEFFLLI
jgi:hypothetical protein